MELEVEDRRPVGRPKKIWNKVVEEGMRKLSTSYALQDNGRG